MLQLAQLNTVHFGKFNRASAKPSVLRGISERTAQNEIDISNPPEADCSRLRKNSTDSYLVDAGNLSSECQTYTKKW